MKLLRQHWLSALLIGVGLLFLGWWVIVGSGQWVVDSEQLSVNSEQSTVNSQRSTVATPYATRATPSSTPTPENTPHPTLHTPHSTDTPLPTDTPSPTFTPTVTPYPIAFRERFGIAGNVRDIERAHALGLPFGSYLNWNVLYDPPRPGNAQFWQMIRLSEAGIVTEWDNIELALANNPGSIWLIGNEPDAILQDNVTPGRYAELYHELYTYIKTEDPTAQIAIAGVIQPTPLRMAYLDEVLLAYQTRYGEPLPVDIWNVHAFILREERGSWGAEIPPGLDTDSGLLYEIEQHDDIELLQQHIIDFRAWMAERGYGNHPLAVTEYGIVMPPDFGFPPEAVSSFMTDSFDFFLDERNDTGLPADDNRLVQWWFWFMLFIREDGLSTGNLYDRPSRQLTPLGNTFADYVLNNEP